MASDDRPSIRPPVLVTVNRLFWFMFAPHTHTLFSMFAHISLWCRRESLLHKFIVFNFTASKVTDNDRISASIYIYINVWAPLMRLKTAAKRNLCKIKSFPSLFAFCSNWIKMLQFTQCINNVGETERGRGGGGEINLHQVENAWKRKRSLVLLWYYLRLQWMHSAWTERERAHCAQMMRERN